MTKYENIVKKKDDRGPSDLTRQIGELQCENEGLKNKIADFEETLKSRDYTRQHDYQFLIDENRRLLQKILLIAKKPIKDIINLKKIKNKKEII